MRPTILATLWLAFAAAGLPATAQQSPFAPAIEINEGAITYYELDQRAKMLQVFGTAGDLPALAREQLVEETLKRQELRRVGLRLTEGALERQLEEFATRTNMPYDQFVQVLAGAGVAEETLVDFVEIGVSWRDYVRSRYGDRVNVTDTEVERAIATRPGQGSAIEVLLNEIIIAAPPPRAAAAMARAERISRLTSFGAFEAQAREVSALPSRAQGGRIDWLPVSNYPPALQQVLLDLAPGEVTSPIPITNGVALFQLRDVREVSAPVAPPAEIEYAAFYIDGGLSEAGLREAARVDARVDTCDDLYGVAQGLPADQLQRDSLPPAQIPQDVAMELAKLDPGEVSYSLTRAEGRTLIFLMLCGRTPGGDSTPDRDAVRNQLQSQKLAGYADALLAELEARATIRTR